MLLPSPIHHGLHSDLLMIQYTWKQENMVAIPYSSRVAFGHEKEKWRYIQNGVAIPYSSRVAFGHIWEIIDPIEVLCCHPLFITGCIRTRSKNIWWNRRTCCHPLFITGCIRTTFQQNHTVPNSQLPSPIHHGLHSDLISTMLVSFPSIGCHPLFITGCIRTNRIGHSIYICT